MQYFKADKKIILMFILTLALLFMGISGCAKEPCRTGMVAQYFDVPVTVTGPFDIKSIEDREMVEIKFYGGKKTIPFGLMNPEWEALKIKIKPNDCLFFFNADPAGWEELRGRQGYIVIRNGDPVDALTTTRN